jgi:hypothetical protein
MGRERMGERVESGALRWRENVVDSQGWKHFLGSLKLYVETGTGQPW